MSFFISTDEAIVIPLNGCNSRDSPERTELSLFVSMDGIVVIRLNG